MGAHPNAHQQSILVITSIEEVSMQLRSVKLWNGTLAVVLITAPVQLEVINMAISSDVSSTDMRFLCWAAPSASAGTHSLIINHVNGNIGVMRCAPYRE